MKPKHFSTIKQPIGSNLCGACCAAMAAGRSLSHFLEHAKASVDKNGRAYFRIKSVAQYLAAQGILIGYDLQCADNQLSIPGAEIDRDFITVQIPIQDNPALVVIGNWADVATNKFQHMVFWDGKTIRDPRPQESDGKSLDDFEILWYMPLSYLPDEAEI